MPSHALPREAAVFVEASFCEAQTDWNANATEIWVIEPDVSGVTMANLANANIVPRRTYLHKNILGLKSESTLSLSIYAHAAGVSAAEAAAAAATIQTTLLKACVGGLDLGRAAGIASGTATAPVMEAGTGTNLVAGDWGFFYDTSATTGRFVRIESIATETLTLLEDLHFTPDGGGADTMHAVIDCYPNVDALDDHADANHLTLGWLVQGQDAEDVYELRGCKPSLGPIAITAGEPVRFELAHKVTTWATTPSAATFTTAPSGNAPNVPGTGSSCSVRLGTFGGAMAEVSARGTVTLTPAIDYAAEMGPNGVEGVHGYVATAVETGATIEIMVDYDAAYDDEYEAQTMKHLIVQIGNTPLTAWGIYCPRMEYAEKPQRVDEGGITSSRLVFRLHEDTATVSGLTGDNIDKRRAPWHLLFAA